MFLSLVLENKFDRDFQTKCEISPSPSSSHPVNEVLYFKLLRSVLNIPFTWSHNSYTRLSLVLEKRRKLKMMRSAVGKRRTRMREYTIGMLRKEVQQSRILSYQRLGRNTVVRRNKKKIYIGGRKEDRVGCRQGILEYRDNKVNRGTRNTGDQDTWSTKNTEGQGLETRKSDIQGIMEGKDKWRTRNTVMKHKNGVLRILEDKACVIRNAGGPGILEAQEYWRTRNTGGPRRLEDQEH
jgi:hypothetical protein